MQTEAFPSWQNQPFRLDIEEIANPNQILDRFFDDRSLPEHREILWEIQSAAVSSSSAEFFTAKEGGEWILYFRQLEELIEAAFIIFQQKDQTNKE